MLTAGIVTKIKLLERNMATSKKSVTVNKAKTEKNGTPNKRDEWGILEASYMLSNRDINYENCYSPARSHVYLS
jgi:hypothetical protein